MARIQNDLERRKLLRSKIYWAVVGFFAGLLLPLWFPFFCARLSFEKSQPFWKD